MFSLDDLAQAAEELRCRGLDVCHEILYGPHGGLEGLNVSDEFFPLWELTMPENRDDLERADFAAIQARRGPDWSVEPPIHWRRAVPVTR